MGRADGMQTSRDAMALDLICGFLLVILTFAGLRSGMMAQLTRFAALALIFFGAPPLARALTQWFYGVETLELAPLRLGMTALAASAIYVATMILSYIFLKNKDNPSRGDRIAGAVLGFVKSLIIIYLITDAAVFMEPRLREIDPDDKFQVQNSRLVNMTRTTHQAVPWVEPPALSKLPKTSKPPKLVRPPARRINLPPAGTGQQAAPPAPNVDAGGTGDAQAPDAENP